MTSVPRLIQTFIPNHYELSLDLSKNDRTFSGIVTIQGTSAPEATSIKLHAKDLTIESVLVDGKNAEYSHEDFDELHISHPNTAASAPHIVTVAFRGTITDTMNGIYPSYFEVDGVKKELIATQFESHYARQAFPCIDEPEAKATFDVTLKTQQENIVVLGNMPVANQQIENNLLVTTFQTTPRMSTYLVAWVAGELHKKSTRTKDGVEVSVWATAAQSAESLDFALEFTKRTIEFFDDYFGVPYPLPKADMVALPDFSAGAMENWGLLTFREIALLVDPKETTISAKQYVAAVVAHEVSHQWFGNLVTMKWWDDLWLNESFANIMEYIAVDALEPTWNIWLDHASNEVISALRRDSLDGVQAIQSDVNHPDEISTMFDPSIVYAKGGRLLRMLQASIGTDALRAGLKDYFTKHQYHNTEADDLWASLSAVSGKDVGSFMHAWIKQPGYPVVTAKKDGDTITLSASQFFIGDHQPSTRTWPLPLHGSSDTIPEMLVSETLTIPYNDTTPFHLNASGTAHFITHYDTELLSALTSALETLPAIDRLQLLHEQTLLAEGGVISPADLIPLISAYENETEESVWGIISFTINSLKRFVETDEEAEKALRALSQRVSLREYERLGWEARSDESENDTKLRSIMVSLALYGENSDATATAEKLYRDRKTTPLDPELRTAIMAHAVRNTIEPTVLDDLIHDYTATQLSELRDDIASALTSAKSEVAIAKLITLLKKPSTIRTQDFTHWFVWLLRNRFSRNTMWQWTRDEWAWIEENFRDDSHYEMFPRYIASSLMTASHLAEFTSFFEEKKSDKTLARNISIGNTEIQARVALFDSEGPAVRDALKALSNTTH